MLYSYCGISVTVTLTFLVCLVEPMKSTFLPCKSLCKFQCQTFSPLRLLFFRDSIFFINLKTVYIQPCTELGV